MTSHPDFNRLKTALLLKGEPDRVPLMELGVGQKVKEAYLGKKIDSMEAEIEFWEAAGYDYIIKQTGYLIEVRKTLYPEKEEVREWIREDKGIITSDEDFHRYPWPEPQDIDLTFLEEIAPLLPSGMKIISGTCGIFEQVSQVMGLETFCIALKDNPGLVEKLFQRIGSLTWEVFQRIGEHDKVGALWYNDDLAYNKGTIVSPDVLRQYLFPWLKKMGKYCRERDLPFILHSDGNLWAIMEELVEIGFNAIHPIDPTAMDIREVKRRYGDKLCLVGNINLDLLIRGTPEEVEEEVKAKIKDLAPGGGYCLSSSNSIPDSVPPENYRAMVEAGKRYGIYPLII